MSFHVRRAEGRTNLVSWLCAAACLGCSSGSGSGSTRYDPHLPPPYTGAPGALTARTPCPVPIAWPQTLTTTEATTTYDSTRGRIVYTTHDYRTDGAGDGDLFSLWDWDNQATAFTLRTPCGAAIPNLDTQSAYDPSLGVVMLYGPKPVLIHPDTGQIESIPAASDDTTSTSIFYDGTAKGIVAVAGGPMQWNGTARQWEPAGLGLQVFNGSDSSWAIDPSREKIYQLSNTAPVQFEEIDIGSGSYTPMTPSPLPAGWPTIGYAYVFYDSGRDRLVLLSDGTWEWDIQANTWSKLAEEGAGPSAENSVEGVYDAKNGLVTVIEQGPYEPNVWTWDGKAWTSHRPSHVEHAWPTIPFSSPPKEMPFSLTYDTDRHRTLLFAASDDDQAYGNTMEWDGDVWVDRTPADPARSPPSRSNAGLTYDSARHRAVLFGGGDRLTDLWEWDPDAGVWTNRTPSPVPSVWPFGVDRPSPAFNPATDTVFLYEGNTWQWDGGASAWAKNDSGFIDADGEFLVFDQRLGRIVLLGSSFGTLGSGVYDASAQTWSVLHPATSSTSASGLSGGAYDPVRGTITLLSSDDSSPRLLEYDTLDGSMHDETPSALPADWPTNSINGAAMAYDSDRGVLVILTEDATLFERASR